MRKISLVLIFFIFSLVACSNPNNSSNDIQAKAIDELQNGDLLTAEETLSSLSKEYPDITEIDENHTAVELFINAMKSYAQNKDAEELKRAAKTAIARAGHPEIKKALQKELDELLK
jgi:PBP1b-binding outer membrane lipoprotein LpoB